MLRLSKILRFSLGELLLVALGAGLGMAALRSGRLLASAYLFGAVVVLAWVLVAAIVGRKALQAFAIGFLVGIAVYGSVLHWYGEAEFGSEGELVTSRAARPIYEAIREVYYVDVYTQREADAVEAGAAAQQGLIQLQYWHPATADVPLGSTLVAKVGNVYWSPQERPVRREFMQVFHLLAALTLGYVTGKFGAAIYRRRVPTAAGESDPARGSDANSPAPAGETGSRR